MAPQAYGLTETCANTTAMDIHDNSTGAVGPPNQGVHIKLVNWEEGNYRSADFYFYQRHYYRVVHLVRLLGWVYFNMLYSTMLPTCSQPVLPISQLPTQNQADGGTAKTEVNSTQLSDHMVPPVL